MRHSVRPRALLASGLLLLAALAVLIQPRIDGVYGLFSDSETISVSLGASTEFPPIPAAIDIDPDTLNPESQGNYVMAYIELPDGYDVADIDVTTVTLRVAAIVGPACSEPSDSFVAAKLRPTEVGDHDRDGIADHMVKFSRPDVIDLMTGKAVDGLVTLVVSGQLLSSGATFEGCDTIDPPEPAAPAPTAAPGPTPVLTPVPPPPAEATPTPMAEPPPAPEPTATAEPTPTSAPDTTPAPEPTPAATPEPTPGPEPTPTPTPGP